MNPLTNKTFRVDAVSRCKILTSKNDVMCHGLSGTYAWLQVFRWSPLKRKVESWSLSNTPGERLNRYTGSWSSKFTKLELIGFRISTKGRQTRNRILYLFRKSGSFQMLTFTEFKGKEKQVLNVSKKHQTSKVMPVRKKTPQKKIPPKVPTPSKK